MVVVVDRAVVVVVWESPTAVFERPFTAWNRATTMERHDWGKSQQRSTETEIIKERRVIIVVM